MYLEEEFYLFILYGFLLVILLSAISLAITFVKSKNRKLLWFFAQMLSLCISFYFFYRSVSLLPDFNNPMYTEEQSFNLGVAGLFWATSMLLCLIGITHLTKNRERKG